MYAHFDPCTPLFVDSMINSNFSSSTLEMKESNKMEMLQHSPPNVFAERKQCVIENEHLLLVGKRYFIALLTPQQNDITLCLISNFFLLLSCCRRHCPSTRQRRKTEFSNTNTDGINEFSERSMHICHADD